MKSPLLMAGMTLVLASAVLAATPKAAKSTAPKKGAPTEPHCAVMTANKVNVKEATAKHMYADYKGNRYFFCCGGCPSEFKKDPAKYAKAFHIPTPKTK